MGVVLVAAAIWQRRRMQPKKPKKPPRWQEDVGRMSRWFAVGLARVVQPRSVLAACAAAVTDLDGR